MNFPAQPVVKVVKGAAGPHSTQWEQGSDRGHIVKLESSLLKDVRKQLATLELAERFFDSVVLFALYNLGVFRALSNGPKELETLRREAGRDEETVRALLDAAVALKILRKEGDAYSSPDELVECLGREESPAYLGEWIEFLHVLATPLFGLSEVARTGDPLASLFNNSLFVSRMTTAMDAYARTRGLELAERVDFSDAETFLDLGCGPGTYGLSIVQRFPRIAATLLDLPGPIKEARRLVEVRGMSDRVKLVVADAMTYMPEDGYDAVLVSNMLHMLGPAGSQKLLDRCYKMVNPGGKILIQAQYLNDDRISPRWPTLLNLLQCASTPAGRNHAIGETTEWLERAGFTDVEHVRFSTWNVNSVLIGRRPR